MKINLEDMKGFIYHGFGNYGAWREPVSRSRELSHRATTSLRRDKCRQETASIYYTAGLRPAHRSTWGEFVR